jgi:hypothetical protein
MSIAHGIMLFTHINNLPGILAAGCLQADSLVDSSSALKVANRPARPPRRRTALAAVLRPSGEPGVHRHAQGPIGYSQLLADGNSVPISRKNELTYPK